MNARRAAQGRRRRHGRHRPAGDDRHAGPPAGQAPRRAATSSTRSLDHGAEGCNYLLAVDVEMNTVAGYTMSSWEGGYGDFVFKPDLDTLRPVPWHPGTVMCLADLQWSDGSEVVASPRQILRRQLARLAERGWTALGATELEFMVFRDTYEQAWHQRYQDLEPANLYNVDYSVLGTARIEPLLRRIRNEMSAAGMAVENSKGECFPGQHEVNFHYDDALTAADTHVVYKTGAKEIAAQEGTRSPSWRSSTSARATRATSTSPLPRAGRRTAGLRAAAGGVRPLRRRAAGRAARADPAVRARTSTPTSATPRARSRRPRSPGAATTGRARCAPSATGRRCGSRTACPGGDVNPYLALAAMIAAGLHGVDAGARARAGVRGQRLRRPTSRACPRRCRRRATCSRARRSPARRSARTSSRTTSTPPTSSCAAFEAAVTDWERFRGFERL